MTTFYKSSDDDDKTVMISLEKDKKKKMLSTNSSQKMFKNILLKEKENVFAKISAKMFLLLSCFTENVYKIKNEFFRVNFRVAQVRYFYRPNKCLQDEHIG